MTPLQPPNITLILFFQLWEASYTELSNQYRGKLLPPSHVITHHVRRVVSRILDANNLGTLREAGDHQRTSISARTALRPSFAWGGDDGGDGSDVAPDLWDPDAAGRGVVHADSGKEWNLLVVNDPKVVNAMAAPGSCIRDPPPSFSPPRVIRTVSGLGTIVVFTGILPVARDEQGLAAILGHGMSTPWPYTTPTVSSLDI